MFALKTAGVVSTFRTVYSARLQENEASDVREYISYLSKPFQQHLPKHKQHGKPFTRVLKYDWYDNH